MIEKVNKFPLEKLYFLESREFLDKRDKVFLKENDTFKLNSYFLGISRQKYNNDNFLYFFNGLRGYYDVKTRYLKKPAVMQVKPPLSKKVLINSFLIKKYRYSDLLIFSLNDFNRPTITLFSDTAGNLYYDFPYRLVHYLNNQRHSKLLKSSYANWREKYSHDLKHLSFFFFRKFRLRKKASFFRTKLLPAFVLGHFDELILSYFRFKQLKLNKFSNLNKVIFGKKGLKKKKRNNRFKRKFFKKSSFKLKKFYKTPKLIKRFFLAKKKVNLVKKKKKYKKLMRLPILVNKLKLFFSANLKAFLILKKDRRSLFLIKSKRRSRSRTRINFFRILNARLRFRLWKKFSKQKKLNKLVLFSVLRRKVKIKKFSKKKILKKKKTNYLKLFKKHVLKIRFNRKIKFLAKKGSKDYRNFNRKSKFFAEKGSKDDRKFDRKSKFFAEKGSKDDRNFDRKSKFPAEKGSKDDRNFDRKSKFLARKGSKDDRNNR